jgi:hypothetical protein
MGILKIPMGLRLGAMGILKIPMGLRLGAMGILKIPIGIRRWKGGILILQTMRGQSVRSYVIRPYLKRRGRAGFVYR